MDTLIDLNLEFSGFTGSENFYRHWLGGIYTDGIMAVAEKFQAYWLIDAVFSYRRSEAFQIWTLEVKKRQGILTMKEDSDRKPLVKQFIPYTDFPEGILKMYFVNGVLHLPSEY